MLRLGTRGSALALAQTRLVAATLADPSEIEIVTIESSGPSTVDKSRWTGALEQALMRGEIDLAVHSAKDVPVARPAGLVTAAVPRREDPRDRLCGADSPAGLAAGARVGTSSPRRAALIRALREDLTVVELSGNVDTRLRKLADGEADALILAAAGLNRLGLADTGTALDESSFVPAAGQGCLMLECRAGDERAMAATAPANDPDSEAELTAERSVVAGLDADCHSAVGVLARVDGESISLHSIVAAPDGSNWIRDRLEGPASSAAALAERLVANLRSTGADELLALGRGEAS